VVNFSAIEAPSSGQHSGYRTHALSQSSLGQSSAVGIGGDPILGTSFIDILALFERNEETDMVVMVGEIGGSDEEQTAHFVASQMNKPIVAYVAGYTAPAGRQMGHVGAYRLGSVRNRPSKARGPRCGWHLGRCKPG
jgi:succinyl-CoA synthetase alpha subunit